MINKHISSCFTFIISFAILLESTGITYASSTTDAINPQNKVDTSTTVSLPRQSKKIDCDEEKYSGLCYSKETSIFVNNKTLTLEQSERCIGVGLAIKKSATELKRQSAFLKNKERVLEGRIQEGQSGNLSQEELIHIMDDINRFNKQVNWINSITYKLIKLAEGLEYCENSFIHDDATDSGAEEIATSEYNKIWK
jgi:hypothetical protein